MLEVAFQWAMQTMKIWYVFKIATNVIFYSYAHTKWSFNTMTKRGANPNYFFPRIKITERGFRPDFKIEAKWTTKMVWNDWVK